MPVTFLSQLPSTLHRAFEGELAGMAPHERREQHRRQIRLLHVPVSNLLLAIALVGLARVLAQGAWGDYGLPMFSWQLAASAALTALALHFRHIVSLRRRLLSGAAFVTLLLTSLAEPGSHWQQMPVLSLAGFLLLPVAGLPLLVRPKVAFFALAACTLVAGVLVFWLAQIPVGERLAFSFHYLLSSTAGLVLRRARGNLAVHMQRQADTLWQRAVTDPLTGLLNRQGWMSVAETAMRDALDSGAQPAVLFIDVDHFKRINDNHGHQAGDQLLKELGAIINARMGPGDFCARLGGEEFTCLLPRSSPAQAQRLAERLATDYRNHAQRFSSTLSIGVATHGAGDLLNDLLARADAALYEAKHRGRDQVIVAR
ncbi:MAG: GGDEF domain-containing protein [Arenimonas sp.]|uniref:GGDEF domain-containing protein n=1 Tax=Arenimonas sp. TaxID=1872635 RepID=UPI0025B8EC66|nr:GGDEF domain-containing protein [Arenimonas sp.]MBW8367424.1 GGDEF domain-containing protein [Arenimonas sp.]